MRALLVSVCRWRSSPAGAPRARRRSSARASRPARATSASRRSTRAGRRAATRGARALLQALLDGEVQGRRRAACCIVKDEQGDRRRHRRRSRAAARRREDVDRQQPDAPRARRRARGAASWSRPTRAVRLAAAKELRRRRRRGACCRCIEKALAQETDPEIKALLELHRARRSSSTARDQRDAPRRGRRRSARASNPSTQDAAARSARRHDGESRRRGARRAAGRRSRAVEARLAWGERLGVVFTGISLGSILLLAALGLAITYGLMGVINMAHGELMMIGAYATYVVQNLFRSLLARRVRLLPAGRDAGRVPRRRRWSAWCSSAASSAASTAGRWRRCSPPGASA